MVRAKGKSALSEADIITLIMDNKFQKLSKEIENFGKELSDNLVKALSVKMAETFLDCNTSFPMEELDGIQSILMTLINHLHLWPIDIEVSFNHIIIIKKYIIKMRQDIDFSVYEKLYDQIKMNSYCFSNVSSFQRSISSFYAFTWNYMRDVELKANPIKAFYLATFALRWVACLGMRSVETIINKLNQLQTPVVQLKSNPLVLRQLVVLEYEIASALHRQLLSGYEFTPEDQNVLRMRRNLTLLIFDAATSVQLTYYGLLLVSKNVWRSFCQDQLGHFDYLDSPPNVTWETKWMNPRHSIESREKTILMDHIEPALAKEDQMARCQKVCRFELNAYFAYRGVSPKSMMKLGRAIRKYKTGESDFALGNIVEAVGFWWSNDVESQKGLNLCKETISFIDAVQRDDLELFMICPLAKTWLALHYLKRYQIIVKEEAEDLKVSVLAALKRESHHSLRFHPERVSNPLKTFPFISSLNLYDDFRISSRVVEAVDEFTFLMEFNDELLRLAIEKISVAFVQVTIRLLTHLASAQGNLETLVKVWKVVRRIGKITKSNYLVMTSCCELVRLLHHVDQDVLDDLNMFTMNLVKGTGGAKALLLRKNLALAHYYYWKKDYKKGMTELVTVFDHVTNGENFDVVYHLIGDASILLYMYKEKYPQFKKFVRNKKHLFQPMSSYGILSKCFKNLTHALRTFKVKDIPNNQAWHDILFNYDLINSLSNLVPFFLNEIEESGKGTLYGSYLSELIILFQTNGFVLRMLEIITRLARIDFTANAIEACEIKIEGIQKTTKVDTPSFGDPKVLRTSALVKKLNRLGFTRDDSKLVVRAAKLKWTLKSVALPNHHYLIKGGREEATRDCSPSFPDKRFTLCTMLSHPYNCKCVFCSNPRLATVLIEAYSLQGRFAMHGDKKLAALVLLGQSKVLYLKMLLRYIFSFSKRDEFTPKEFIKNSHALFNEDAMPQFIRTLLKLVDLQMENTPRSDFCHINYFYSHALKILQFGDSLDKTYGKTSFYELILQGIMAKVFTGHAKFQEENFRLLVQESSDANEPKYPDSKTPDMPGTQAPPEKNKKARKVAKSNVPQGTRFPNDEPMLLEPIRPLVFSPDEIGATLHIDQETPKVQKTKRRPGRPRK